MGYAAVVANYFFPEQVFIFLINSSGAIQLIYYIILVGAEIRLRRRLEASDPGALRLKMWCFPYLSWFSIAWMAVVLGLMAWIEETRSQFLLSLVAFGVIMLAYRVRAARGSQQIPSPTTGA
jgi:GABA permease